MSDPVCLNSKTESKSSGILLEPFFAPKSVAIIGASAKPGNQGGRIVESLRSQGFRGRITTVHPQGIPFPDCEAVVSIKDLPEETDLAISAVSSPQVLQIIQPLAEKGIHNLIVISGGFAETSAEGRKLQNELQKSGQQWQIRMIGPNCLGTFSAPDHFNSFFLSQNEVQLPGCGPIAFISQSGAFLSAILDQLARRGLGVHRAISFGNRIDLGECEAIEAFAGDPAVKVIGIYLESVQDGRRFFESARRITPNKPIVICKGGRTEKGNQAIQAHSASLAGSYSVFQAACKQAGVIEVQGLSELVNALQVLSLQAPPKGNRVLIASNGGGMGVLLTDLCEQKGCLVEEPPVALQQELKEILPAYYSFKNPVDLTGSGTNEQCALALDKLLNRGLYDCLLLVVLSGTEGINADIASKLRSILPQNFPVVLGAYGKEMYQKLCTTFQKEGIPVFPTGEEAAWAVNLLVKSRNQKETHKNISAKTATIYDPLPLIGSLDSAHETLDEMQMKKKLSECGVQIPKRYFTEKRAELKNIVEQVGFPIILKVIGREVLHKTELKGIRPDLYEEKELISAWEDLNRNWPNQVWAEEQMPPGLDLMVGVYRDNEFGPVLLFGTGGKYLEVYNDIERLLLPAGEDEIQEAILRTHAGKIITGIRGEEPLDIKKLSAFIRLIQEWIGKETRLLSLDFNPIRLYANSLAILDAKMTTLKISGEDKP
jgi:acetate---CoA ligase (ADP-forming)